ncbi:MAG TPA: helix-turn-helix transcriptional regulator [Thermoanaerobaculia bacterium]|nr:helix-turn-helix transcriptional regulator [Thermoanaerobaculia bacterium]
MTIEDEVRRATKLLETVMQAAGLTRKELDQRLGAGPGYISQVLTGRMELKFRHILAILRALDVEPNVFFQTLYPGDRPSSDQAVMEEFLKRFQKLGFGAAPPPQPPAVDSRELERLVESAVRAALGERMEDAEASTRDRAPGERPEEDEDEVEEDV